MGFILPGIKFSLFIFCMVLIFRFSPSIDVGNVNGRETGYHTSTASTSSLQDEVLLTLGR